MPLVREDRLGDGVIRLTLDRPDQRNAVSSEMLQELRGALELAAEPGVRAVILAGAGPDFCAGADIAELSEAIAEPAAYGRTFEEALAAIQDHPVPVIAQVHGAALGAGCQIAVACDLAVAAEDARLGVPSGRLGIVINAENVARLVAAVGKKRAGEMLYAGRVVSGAEAAAWGLVNEAVPAGDVASRAQDLAATVAQGAPLSVRASKAGVGAALERLSLENPAGTSRLSTFHQLLAEVFSSDDLAEGIRAFRERRHPRFRGR